MEDVPDQTQRKTILIVDDTPDNLVLMNGVLKDTYRTKVANNGERALKMAANLPVPDLILLDVMMPGIDGYEVCRRLKSDPVTAGIPVIFLTSMTGIEDEQRGFAAGGADYIAKPISLPIVEARVRLHLENKAARDILRDQNRFLESEVNRRVEEMAAIHDVTILAMASLAETRENETGAHIRRTQAYVRRLAQALRDHPRFSGHLTNDVIDLLCRSAPLHGIGKAGIPDAILLKPGKLTEQEFEIMKTHTTLGRDAIMVAEKHLAVPSSFLRLAREIAYSHQEKWDGSGYPLGMAGDAIPVSARLMAVASVYDALISKRVYKPAFSHERAVAIIAEARGTHFDPDVVDAFVAIADEFRDIALRFSNPPGAEQQVLLSKLKIAVA